MSREPSARHPVRSTLALLTTALIWGLAFVAQRASVDSLGAFSFNGLRFALGALSLLPVALLWSRGPWRDAWLPGLAAGLVLWAAASLQQLGLTWTSAGKAAFITGFYILLVPIFGLALRHRAGLGVWLGAALGLAGLFLLSVTEALTVGPGDALTFAGALFWALHVLVIDRFAQRVDPLKLSVVQFAVCAAASLLAALPTETLTLAGVRTALVPLLFAGVASVGIAYTLQVVGQRGIAAAPAALILSLETVFAALGGWLILGEQLGPRELAGCALVLAGTVLAQVWPRRPGP